MITWKHTTVNVSIGALLLLALGCSGAAQDGEHIPSDDAATVKSTREALTADYTDSTGTVTVRIKQCALTTSQEHPTAQCSVDSGFVLVGGGAEILNDGTPGALLTASYPDLGLTTWTASSKDHYTQYFHQLRAYSIGMKLSGVTAATLFSYMGVWTSPPAAPAEVVDSTATVGSGYQLIGGGARANYSGAGLLLTESYPLNTQQWAGSAKDHVTVDFGTVDTFAIGVTTGTIPGFGTLATILQSAHSAMVRTGYASDGISVNSGYVIASVGGLAQFNRLLTELIPFSDYPSDQQPGFWAQSKDHVVVANGATYVYGISVKRQ